MTAAELSALTGLSLASAEEELTRLMVEYDGEVEVADDGTLLYVFEEVLPSASAAGTRWTWAWDRPIRCRRSRATRRAPNGSRRLRGLQLARVDDRRAGVLAALPSDRASVATLLRHAVPADLLGDLLRRAGGALGDRSKRKLAKRERRMLRRELLREIWSRPGEPRDPAELTKRAAERIGAAVADAQKMLDTLVRDLDGDITTDAEGAMRYRLPAARRRSSARSKRRALAAPDRQLGEVDLLVGGRRRRG